MDKENEDQIENEKQTSNIDPDEIANSVKDKITGDFDAKFNKFTQDISSKFDSRAKEDDDDDDLDDDDTIITKADLKKFSKSLQSDIRKTTTDVINEYSNKNSRDTEAFNQFPLMNKNSEYYDKTFETAVEAEMDRRIKNGRDVEDPDLIYDSAASVFATNPKWQKYKDKVVEENYQKDQTKFSNFQQSNRAGNDSKDMTKRQAEIANRFGIDPKRSKELRKKYNY